MILMILIFLGLTSKIFYLQFIIGNELQKKAFENQYSDRYINPRRGTIYDRNGEELATSANVRKIAVNPQQIKELSKAKKESFFEELAGILEMDYNEIIKIANRNTRYELIKNRIDEEAAQKVRELVRNNNVKGMYIDEDMMRFYPNGNLAAHVIGFTGTDNQGLSGIEASMDKYLKGTKGRIINGADALGRELPLSEERYIDAQHGYSITLTIDKTIQHITQNIIDKAIDDNNVLRGASAIVMEPSTGEILAMVSKPDFNLNDPFAPPIGVDRGEWKGTTQEDVDVLWETVWRNKAISDTYEPGSTFKAITSAAGLEEGFITPESRVTDATIFVGGWQIDCWKPNAHKDESFAEGLQNSCNPVFVRLAQNMGIDIFYNYVDGFGFYDKTGINLPGEAESIFHKSPTEVDMAVASFGQRFQITPIQLITSYCAIANGGKLIKPGLIKELRDSNGNIVVKNEAETKRQVISKKTSDTLKKLLEDVVAKGTGRNAYVAGCRVAGKTGTSETIEADRRILSFIAFAPAENPVVCALVILDDPDVYPKTGGMVAAPVAGELIDEILNYLEVERIYTEKDKEMLIEEVFVPDLRDKTVGESKAILRELGLKPVIEGNPDEEVLIYDQTPKPDINIQRNSIVILYTYETQNEIMVAVPDVLNKTVNEARQALNSAGLNINVNGVGVSVEASFKQGDLVPKGEIVNVEFKHIILD